MTIDARIRRIPRRDVVVMGLVGVVAGALVPATSSAFAAVPAEPDLAAVELMEDAIEALGNGDDQTYDALLGTAFDGSIWLPNAAIIALEDRDAEDIVAWSAVLDSTDDELVGDWAYEAIEIERDALAVLDEGVELTLDQADDIDDADFDGAAVLEVIDHRTVAISEPTREVLSSSLEADGIFPDESVYQRALLDIDAGLDGPAEAVAAPPVDDSNITTPPAADSVVVPADTVATESTVAASPDAEQSSPLLMAIAIGLAATALLVGLITAFRGRKTHQLADIAFTDGLTGLNNRRRLDADVVAQRERGYRATSALMVDVDHFKQFNDTHGHDMGDEVLRLVGDVLSREFRKSDVPYRYGGEEFCVLLNDVTADEARAAGERLRRAIETIELPISESITASIGVSTGPAMELPNTIKRADGALYVAKDAGRNRVADS